jgi:hypothetical protein
MVSTLVLGLWAGLRVGGVFPQPFGPLESNLTFGVEGGMVLPYRDGLFGIDAQVQYAQPPAEGTGDDPRLAAMSYEWSISQRELSFGARGLVRLPVSAKLVGYGALGPRLYLLETRANGAAGGQPLGEHREVSTELGAQLAAGAVYAIASAGIFGELGVAFSNLDHVTTGDASTGQLELVVGARLEF